MSSTIKEAMKKAGVTKKTRRQVPKPAVSDLKHGKIKWFDLRKGYGFITCEGDDREYFVHFSKIMDGRSYLGFEEEDEVSFQVNIDPETNRPQAIKVSLDSHTPRVKNGTGKMSAADPESDAKTDNAE